MGRALITLTVVLFLGLVAAFVILRSNSKPNSQTTSPTLTSMRPQITNIKASFAIFTNNTFRIFTDPKYHNRSIDVYMDTPNIVIVKKIGVTWGDFFKTLPMKLTKDCLTTGTGQVFCSNETESLKFYINGELDSNALDKEIGDGDKLLVSYGNKSKEEIDIELKQVPDIN